MHDGQSQRLKAELHKMSPVYTAKNPTRIIICIWLVKDYKVNSRTDNKEDDAF